MRDVSQAFLDAVEGSVQPFLLVDAWYADELLYSAVPVSSGEAAFDADASITGSVSLTVITEDDTLVPETTDAPLACYGSQLHVRAGLKLGSTVEYVSLGWFLIVDTDVDEQWRPYYPDKIGPGGTDLFPDTTLFPATTVFPGVFGPLVLGDPKWVRSGSVIRLTANDRMQFLEDDRMLAPEQPASLGSCIGEITRLARDDVPVATWAGVTDQTIPKSIAYQQSRTGNIQALADVLGQVARMDPDGALAPYPASPSGDPVWSVAVGATAVKWSNRQQRDGIPNAVVAAGEATDAPVQGVATETTGPFRYGGPFGRVPFGYASSLLTDQARATAAARTVLARKVSERVVPVTVECVLNPAIEVGDVIEVVQPQRTITGPVRTVRYPLTGAATMTLGLLVPRSQLLGAAS